jgi:tripartite-type tricarboxylate transporter receptor subunit TctC
MVCFSCNEASTESMRQSRHSIPLNAVQTCVVQTRADMAVCACARRRARIGHAAARFFAAIAFALLPLLPGLSVAHAQGVDAYPSRPIILIVPFPPGGTNDILARILSERMSKPLGQQVVVENRAGAGGNIGSRQAARSAPDGYTLLLTYVGTLAINPAMYADMGYDPDTQLTPIGSIATAVSVLVVHPSFPARTVRELIAYAKANPGQVNFASSGIGTGVHVGMEMFADGAGIDIKHIPYRGTGPALTDLLAGHVKVMLPPIPTVISNVRAGLLLPLGVTSTTRSPLLPELPTIDEAGLPGFSADARFGLMAPAGTPRPIVERLNRELRAALVDEGVRKRMLDDGLMPQPDTPEDYAAANAVDKKVWGGIVRKLGLKVE